LGGGGRGRAPGLGAPRRTRIGLEPASLAPPASAASDVQTAIERAAAAGRWTTMRLPSGAGHDAQMMAQIAPMGMIFVPSVGGVSHSPKELTHGTIARAARTCCSALCWRWIAFDRWMVAA